MEAGKTANRIQLCYRKEMYLQGEEALLGDTPRNSSSSSFLVYL